MKVDEIIDRMEYVVHHARRVPFSAQVIVDEEEIVELLDELRASLPEEIKQANRVVQEHSGPSSTHERWSNYECR